MCVCVQKNVLVALEYILLLSRYSVKEIYECIENLWMRIEAVFLISKIVFLHKKNSIKKKRRKLEGWWEWWWKRTFETTWNMVSIKYFLWNVRNRKLPKRNYLCICALNLSLSKYNVIYHVVCVQPLLFLFKTIPILSSSILRKIFFFFFHQSYVMFHHMGILSVYTYVVYKCSYSKICILSVLG